MNPSESTSQNNRFRFSNQFLLVVVIALFFGNGLSAKNVYVSHTGSDSNSGSIHAPFKSIQMAVSVLKAGDKCYIRGGRYFEEINFDHVSGKAWAPITITAFPGENVIFDGTRKLKGKWDKVSDHIYKLKVKKPVWQLFKDEKMQVIARWPNASFDDGSIWDMKSTWRHQAKKSEFGLMYDERPVAADYKNSEDEGASSFEVKDGANMESLAQTNIDFTGAIAVLNIGSWLSWAQPVVKHEKGSDHFSYDKDFSRKKKSLPNGPSILRRKDFFNAKKNQGHYYLLGKMALDSPNEWFYDNKEKAVYVYLPDGKSPKDYKFKGKCRDFLVEGTNAQHVKISHINFFAGTFQFTRSKNISIDQCHFLYPSYHKLALKQLEESAVTGFLYPKKELRADRNLYTDNQITNCRFEYADGPGFRITGRGDKVENCYFHDIDWTCLGSGASGSLEAIGADKFIFRYNTVHTGGNSEGVRAGNFNTIEFNHIYNLSLLQHDGSGINVGVDGIEGTIIKNNWVHDIKKSGIRFDSRGYQTPFVQWGEKGRIINNVVWNTASIKAKGNRHEIENNLVFGTLKGMYDIGVPRVLMMGSNNSQSIIKNNIAPHIGGHFSLRKAYTCPGIVENNWEGNPEEILIDPINYDFRPSAAIQKKYRSQSKTLPGPYTLDPKDFWIPGFRDVNATTPVPVSGAKKVSENLSLFWNKAQDAVLYKLFLSQDSLALSEINPKKKYLLGETEEAFWTPRKISSEQRCFWRVDVIDSKSKTHKGDIWSFGGAEKIKLANVDVIQPRKFEQILSLPLPFSNDKTNFSSEILVQLKKLYNEYWNEYENNKWLKKMNLALAQNKLSQKKKTQLLTFKKQVYLECEQQFLLKAKEILSEDEVVVLEEAMIQKN